MTKQHNAQQTPRRGLPARGGRHGRRGSILLMVVGMLTIVAMLGTIFLLVARQDESQSTSVVAKSQTDPVISGIITRISAALATDRHATSRPYDGMAAGAWGEFIDSADPDVDDWLTDMTGPTIRPSYLLGVKNANPNEEPDVCTDGDGVPDAWLMNTGLTDPQGNRFYVAVKIIDASSRININTAGFGGPPDPDTDPTAGGHFDPAKPILPDYVNLHAFLSPSDLTNYRAYNTIHMRRGGDDGIASATDPATSPLLKDYTRQAGMRPMKPVTAIPRYLPFAVSDEPFLMYTAGTMVYRGRLYDLCSADSVTFNTALPSSRRPMLTTWNASTQGLRFPVTDDAIRRNFWTHNSDGSIVDSGFVTGLIDPNDNTTRERLYDRLCELLPDRPDDAGKQLAAQLVANLWAYCTPIPDDTAAIAYFQNAHYFNPEGTIEAYGMMEQLVFTEAVSWKRAETTRLEESPTPGIFNEIENEDGGWFYAIEIYNPTTLDIPVRDASGEPLFIVRPASTTDDSKDFQWTYRDGSPINTMGPGERIVLYDFDGVRLDPTVNNQPKKIVTPDSKEGLDGETKTKDLTDAFFFATVDNNIIRWADANGAGGYDHHYLDDNFGGVKLFRKAAYGKTVGGYDKIALDTIAGPPLAPDLGDDMLGDEDCISLTRDDVSRSLVAEYYQPRTTNRSWVWSELPLADENVAGSHTLAATNHVGSGYPSDIRPGFDFDLRRLAHRPMLSLGELTDLWVIGPEGAAFGNVADPTFLTVRLKNDKATLSTPSRARVDFTPLRGPAGFAGEAFTGGNAAMNVGDTRYPDVPWACLLGELFDCVPTDSTRPAYGERVYGRININTAPAEVLKQLPWPTAKKLFDGESYEFTVDPEELAEYIIAYRQADATLPALDPGRFQNRSTVLTGLRGGKAFLTPGELAFVLNDYVEVKLGTNHATAVNAATFLDERNKLYHAVANLITVNSDVFQATVLVQLREVKKSTGALTGKTLQTWRYVALMDRGNCMQATDRPTVLLMTEVK